MDEITIVTPEGLEEGAKKMINELKRRKDILDKTFGLIKTKSAKELKVDLYAFKPLLIRVSQLSI